MASGTLKIVQDLPAYLCPCIQLHRISSKMRGQCSEAAEHLCAYKIIRWLMAWQKVSISDAVAAQPSAS